LLILLAACGYARRGRLTAQTGPARPVYVEMFTDRTGEFGLTGAFHQAMIDWLQESRGLRVVFDRDEAAYTVSGSIERVEFPGTSYGPDDTPTGLKAVVDLAWRIKKDGRVLRRRRERREAAYGAAAQAAMTRSLREKAIRRLADEVAEQVYVQISELIASGSDNHNDDER
jgi:hypothetical protein